MFYIFISLSFAYFNFASADYWTQRNHLINLEFSKSTGGKLNLSFSENLVNEVLMKHKLKELKDGFQNPKSFPPSMHFFKSKNLIEQSEVFKIIQKIPKGASLHSHSTALVSTEYVYNLTYSENLYGCIINNRLIFGFPGYVENIHCAWKLVKDLRKQNNSFDTFLKTQINLVVDNPRKSYKDINQVWSYFLDTFTTLGGLIRYKPIFEDYFYQSLKELHEDNVFYCEIRTSFPKVYESNGFIYRPENVTQLYLAILSKFKRDYPTFHGCRIMYSRQRNVDNQTMKEYSESVKKLVKLYPDFVAGFDLVGQEDPGEPLSAFIPELSQLGHEVKFFFHAGETDWNGAKTDRNLIDAVLLNTTRIGHGYALTKHPEVLEIVKQRQIGIEICPISNQVLMLIDDLRNHPGAVLLNSGFPVVICNDDPSFWGAKGLSYDWYMAFMGLASWEADLRLLKQLAINSIKLSAMPPEEQSVALLEWEFDWMRFINNYINFLVDEKSVRLIQ